MTSDLIGIFGISRKKSNDGFKNDYTESNQSLL